MTHTEQAARWLADVPRYELYGTSSTYIFEHDALAAIARHLAPGDDLVEAGDDWDELMVEARAEAAKAMRKFPQPNYVISKIAEEAGEVVKAAIHCAEGRETAENLRGEMKQTLAMLYRLWVEGDQIHGLPPVRAALIDGGSNG